MNSKIPERAATSLEDSTSKHGLSFQAVLALLFVVYGLGLGLLVTPSLTRFSDSTDS